MQQNPQTFSTPAVAAAAGAPIQSNTVLFITRVHIKHRESVYVYFS